MAEKLAKPVSEAVAHARRGESDAGERRGSGRSLDIFGGTLRRRDVLPLLVLHLVALEPAYGNSLIERIGDITEGAISVNPNTIYPLLRDLEERGLIRGEWEHPDRRTRRFYAITASGRREQKRLRAELEPLFDSVMRSVSLIKDEIYD